MTPRQVLKREVQTELATNKARVALQNAGKTFTMSDGTKIIYAPIEPKTLAMYELIEGTARRLSKNIWNWYLSASDEKIDRLANEANKEA